MMEVMKIMATSFKRSLAGKLIGSNQSQTYEHLGQVQHPSPAHPKPHAVQMLYKVKMLEVLGVVKIHIVWSVNSP